jgi:hypothetical protein
MSGFVPYSCSIDVTAEDQVDELKIGSRSPDVSNFLWEAQWSYASTLLKAC